MSEGYGSCVAKEFIPATTFAIFTVPSVFTSMSGPIPNGPSAACCWKAGKVSGEFNFPG